MLLGKRQEYIEVEAERMIREALLIDDRITDVINFEFEQIDRAGLHVTFSVVSKYGTFIQSTLI